MLHKRSLREKLLKGGAWATLGRFLAALFLVVLNGFLAKLLSPEEMGAYILIFSIVSFVAVLAQLGLPQVVVRFTAAALAREEYRKVPAVLGWAVLVCGVGSVVAGGLIISPVGNWVAIDLFDSKAIAASLPWIAIWVVALALLQLLAEGHRGLHDIRMASVFGGAASGGIALLLLLGYWWFGVKVSLAEALSLSVVSWTMAAILSAIILYQHVHRLPQTQVSKDDLGTVPDTNLPSEMAGVAWSLWLVAIGTFVLLQCDLWIVSIYCSESDTAIYGSAARLMILVALPLMLVNSVVQPVIAEAFALNLLKEKEFFFRAIATLVSAVALGAFLIILFAGDWILGVIYGSYYEQGYWILVILTLGKVIDVLSGSCLVMLSIAGYQKDVLIITFSVVVLTVFVDILVVPTFGMLGAAFVSATALMLHNVSMTIMVKIRVGIWVSCYFPTRKLFHILMSRVK